MNVSPPLKMIVTDMRPIWSLAHESSRRKSGRHAKPRILLRLIKLHNILFAT
jgi:hypothetical protein